MPLRLGTRASPLAQWQAHWVAGELRSRGVEVEIAFIETTGDVASGSLATFGGVGVFTKEIQRALLDRRVDLAVHSLKDLPTEPVSGLVLAAVPERETTRDALISRDGRDFASLTAAAKIGTGSTRRRASLLHVRTDLVMLDIRGNVETRLKKLDAGEFDAIVLAEAGLKRLGLDGRITQLVPRDMILPAVGQGALGLETRGDDQATRAAVELLNDPATHASVLAERALLAGLRAGCLAPVGAWGRIEAGKLLLEAVVLSPDGQQQIAAETSGPADRAAELGLEVAAELLAAGAKELIAAAQS